MTGIEGGEGPITLTREELYRQVWETPMSRLAEQYGITGNGLAKICRRLDIPYPGRGYCARKAAGKNEVIFRLPNTDRNRPNSVTIRQTPPAAEPPKSKPELQARVEQARTSAEALTVPERLVRPHPIIAGWLADHERRKQEARRERDPLMRKLAYPGEFSTIDRRQHRILHALFAALERQGGRIRQGERREIYVEMSGERIEFQLREKLKQVRRPLNDDEKRWASLHSRPWKQELQSTGKLIFVIKTYLPGLRTE